MAGANDMYVATACDRGGISRGGVTGGTTVTTAGPTKNKTSKKYWENKSIALQSSEHERIPSGKYDA